MPRIYDGESYRTFADPSIFEAETEAQVKQIEFPVDKAFAFVGDPDGGSFDIWRFNSTSTDAASATVLVPNNPSYADVGRWIKMPVGGGGGGPNFLSGNGDPNGVQVGDIQGQIYTDLDDGSVWTFTGTVGTDTGWL